MSPVTQHSVPLILAHDEYGGLTDSAADKQSTSRPDHNAQHFLYDLELKQQSATWKPPLQPRKKNHKRTGQKEPPLELPPEGATVNKRRWKEILRRLTVEFVVGFGCRYTTVPLHVALCLSRRSCETRFPRVATPSIHHAVPFAFPRLREEPRRPSRSSLPQGKRCGTFPQTSFSGPTDIGRVVCDEATGHQIIDCRLQVAVRFKFVCKLYVCDTRKKLFFLL
jgi:hypothetical protein